jgi:hypothetical protein
MAVPSRWSFGPFRLDPDNSCLWHGTREISLKPKTFAVLHHLETISINMLSPTITRLCSTKREGYHADHSPANDLGRS